MTKIARLLVSSFKDTLRTLLLTVTLSMKVRGFLIRAIIPRLPFSKNSPEYFASSKRLIVHHSTQVEVVTHTSVSRTKSGRLVRTELSFFLQHTELETPNALRLAVTSTSLLMVGPSFLGSGEEREWWGNLLL